MSLFQKIEIGLAIFGAAFVCIAIFSMIVVKTLDRHLEETYDRGYLHAVQDITEKGYYIDRTGHVNYVKIEKSGFVNLNKEEEQ